MAFRAFLGSARRSPSSARKQLRREPERRKRARLNAEATKLAIDRSAINQERVAVELGSIGFANMKDYMRIGPSGDPVLDFSNLTREQAAALTEVTVDISTVAAITRGMSGRSSSSLATSMRR